MVPCKERGHLDRDLLLVYMDVVGEFGCSSWSCSLVDKVHSSGCSCLGLVGRNGSVGSWDMVAGDTNSCSYQQQVLSDNLDLDKLDFHRQSVVDTVEERKSWQELAHRLVDGMLTNR